MMSGGSIHVILEGLKEHLVLYKKGGFIVADEFGFGGVLSPLERRQVSLSDAKKWQEIVGSLKGQFPPASPTAPATS